MMWSPAGGAPSPRAGAAAAAAAAVVCLLVTGTLVAHVGHPMSGDPPEPPAAAAASRRVFSAYFRKLTRERRSMLVPPRRSSSPEPPERPSQSDLFLAVKSTQRFHRERLELLLDTWISRSAQQTYVFSDGEDEQLRKRLGDHLINTNCSATHSRQALSCKMALEYDAFISSGKKWFCHLDDDNYLNVGSLLALLSQHSPAQDVYIGRPSLERPIQAAENPGTPETTQVSFWFATGGAGFCLSRGLALKMQPWASGGVFMETAERISLPDDCTVGYIANALLGASLTRSPFFHSHLENLGVVSDIPRQVTLSYGAAEDRRNTVSLRGPFSTKEDPTRFRSVHCLLYPDTPWCPRQP